MTDIWCEILIEPSIKPIHSWEVLSKCHHCSRNISYSQVLQLWILSTKLNKGEYAKGEFSSSSVYSLCYWETREVCVCQPSERQSTGGFSLFSALSAEASSVCSVTGLHCQAEWSDPHWGSLERKVHLPLQTVKYSPAVFLRFIRQMWKGLRCCLRRV